MAPYPQTKLVYQGVDIEAVNKREEFDYSSNVIKDENSHSLFNI